MLPVAIKYGLSVFDYWEMTFDEITMYIKSHQELEEDKLRENYTLAVMIAAFVGRALDGKQIPSFEELTKNKSLDNDEPKMDASLSLYKDQWQIFAENRKKQMGRKNEIENIEEVKQ